MPAIGAEFSRAQRYVVGAAIAATVATAGCSSPTVVRNPDEVGNVTVDVNDTQGDRDQRKSLEFATDPNNDEARIAEERARREREEQERRNRKDRVMHDDDENDDRRNDEWERRRRWVSRPGRSFRRMARPSPSAAIKLITPAMGAGNSCAALSVSSSHKGWSSST